MSAKLGLSHLVEEQGLKAFESRRVSQGEC